MSFRDDGESDRPAGTSDGPEQLALYATHWCFFCRRVFEAIDRLGLDIEIRDINREPVARGELLAARGRSTVPVLRITHTDGSQTWMPESRDIVRYLESRFER
jgi:glutathione S-transferase